MAKVVVTALADSDLAEIIAYLAERGTPGIAERYAREFDAVFTRLGEFPGLGAPRPLLGANARIAIVPPYVAVYDYEDDRVTILRVLHGRPRFTGRLFRKGGP